MGCFPRCDSMIDQATSFKITTCGRFVLKASGGIMNTLRPTSGTGTSHCHVAAATRAGSGRVCLPGSGESGGLTGYTDFCILE